MWIVGHLHKLPIWFSSSKTDTWVDFKNSVFQIVAKGKKKKISCSMKTRSATCTNFLFDFPLLKPIHKETLRSFLFQIIAKGNNSCLWRKVGLPRAFWIKKIYSPRFFFFQNNCCCYLSTRDHHHRNLQQRFGRFPLWLQVANDRQMGWY